MTQDEDFFTAVGRLGAVTVLDADALRLLYRVELAGETFYNQLADRIGNPRAADLLRRNGREERGHAERARKVLGLKQGSPWQPTAADQAPYALPLPDEIPPPMLAMIVQGELDGDAGYQRWADQESDPEIQRLLRQSGREETTHGERVREVLAILNAQGGTS